MRRILLVKLKPVTLAPDEFEFEEADRSNRSRDGTRPSFQLLFSFTNHVKHVTNLALVTTGPLDGSGRRNDGS